MTNAQDNAMFKGRKDEGNNVKWLETAMKILSINDGRRSCPD
jgi:hypothetical protein